MSLVKRAFILRGLPGSGKSTLAALLAHGADQYRICSSDQYFMTDGKYAFNPTKLGENHARNLSNFIQGCSEGIPCMIVDNTNTQAWEYMAYVEAAKALDYEIFVIIVGQPKDPHHIEDCARRNLHEVPFEIICKMSERFEL